MASLQPCALGRLAPESATGKLTLYRGEGYAFHSYLRPDGWTFSIVDAEASEVLRVEAKPKGQKEPRLKDALFTLSKLESDFSGFVDVLEQQEESTDDSPPDHWYPDIEGKIDDDELDDYML